MKEKSFENEIKKYLKERGHYYVKYFANAYTKRGIPDILACVNGRFVAIEVKATDGRSTELQEWNIHAIQESHGIAMVLYPHQMDEFKKIIENLEIVEELRNRSGHN